MPKIVDLIDEQGDIKSIGSKGMLKKFSRVTYHSIHHMVVFLMENLPSSVCTKEVPRNKFFNMCYTEQIGTKWIEVD